MTNHSHGTHRLDWEDVTLREWDCTIGHLQIYKVENKGRQNRRVRLRISS